MASTPESFRSTMNCPLHADAEGDDAHRARCRETAPKCDDCKLLPSDRADEVGAELLPPPNDVTHRRGFATRRSQTDLDDAAHDVRLHEQVYDALRRSTGTSP